MDLSHPISSLIRTRDAAVLEVLAGTEGALTMSQIWRLAEPGSRQGLYPVMDHLVTHGLVTADQVGHVTAYKLNRDHLLTPAISAVTNARRELITRLGEAVSNLQPAPVYAAVFGSVARREAGPESDIDLCLVVPGDVDIHSDDWTHQILELEDRVLSWTGNRLEPLIFKAADLGRIAEEPIISSIRKDGLTLIGTSFDKVLSAAGSQ